MGVDSYCRSGRSGARGCGQPSEVPPARHCRPMNAVFSGGWHSSMTHKDLAFVLLLCLGLLLASASGHRFRRSRNAAAPATQKLKESVARQFWTGNASIALQHMVFNPSLGVLYVGGTNRLYELDMTQLQVRTLVETGPRFDSSLCHASGCGPQRRVHRTLTDNVNKVLVLDPSASTLIMCGSVSQGACEKFRTANLSLTPEFIPRGIAANDPESSTFAFIGPEKFNPWSSSQALYVGTTFTTVGDYRHDVPAIATRNLYNLDYAEFSFSKQSLLRVDVKYRDLFLVKYVYGFNATDYAYFVTVQKKSPLPGQEELGYISRLARTCISDANYDSYTEITLECHGPDGTNYNLVQDAKLVLAGSDLAFSMGISPKDPVFIGVFAPSVGHTSEPRTSSAVCLYTLKDIEAKFNENIHMCFNGSMQYRNMDYISGPILNGECPEAGTTGNIYSFCEVGLKISGPSPLAAKACLMYRNASLTAIQAAVTATHTVLFLGTSEGIIKKASISGTDKAFEYGEDLLDPGSKVLPDMFLDYTGHFLYVLTKQRVTKYRVEDCGSYVDCNSCLQAKDPYCGWCSLEKRCTVQQACERATFSSPRWLSFSAGQQCIDFEMILPDRMSIDQMATVHLTIRTLPALPSGAKYQCVWGSAPPMDATVTTPGLSCVTPSRFLRPKIPQKDDHVLVPLAVRSSETNKNFVSRNFAFYDCGVHKTCSSCVRSAWACNWCLYENLCTPNASSCAGAVVSGENVSILQLIRENPSRLATHGSGFCPRFLSGESRRLLAADGAKSELAVLVENLPRPRIGQLGFQCVVTIEGATMVVNARVTGNFMRNASAHDDRAPVDEFRRVMCEPTVYRYEADRGEYEASLTLVWNRDHVVDTTPLTLYKCSVLGSHREHQDCSLCVTRPKHYRCAWCEASCRFGPHCPTPVVAAEPLLQASYETRENQASSSAISQCPTPRIDVIQPLTGPIEGGTLVTIEGSNLGLRKEDVEDRVFIGDVPCRVQDYRVSVRITCRTGPAPKPSRDQAHFPVRVKTPAGTTESTVEFTYANVSIEGVWPRKGPASGGTTLSISGRYLNVGSHVSAFLDELPCLVNKTQSSSHRLVCVTARATPLVGAKHIQNGGLSAPRKVHTLIVTIDAAQRFLAMPFTYTPDPRIVEVKPLKTPWSGGRVLTVHGVHLDAVVAPKITVLLQERVLNSSTCSVKNPGVMECPSPMIEPKVVFALLEEQEKAAADEDHARGHRLSWGRSRRASEGVPLDVGFLMDGVASVRHLGKHFPGMRSRLLYVEDPLFYAFANGVKLYKGDTLVIEGDRIDDAADESDVRVTVGRVRCNVTSLTVTQVVCIPPLEQPDSTDEYGNSMSEMLPLVVVHVGTHLRYPLGLLRYERTRQFPLTPEGIACLAGGALFLFLVIFLVLAVYRRKNSQAERVYKLMQLQMDSLESHVRTECKQAFAELQTDMTDLTADLEASGTPMLDQRTYVMKVFFPGVTDHPILNDSKSRIQSPRNNYDVAMLQFEQLLCNKQFLLVFVETMESQKSFSIRDKVNVASLLTVIFISKMEYLTDVLRSLLLHLVASVAATKHPQLMLRRTESVVEKMLTNWLALCMYSYLKDHAGTSLFLLYKAIKHQVEKGPVDAVTHDARYSLCEEKLLREQVDYSVVTIHLLHDDPHYEKIPYQTTYSQTLALYSEEYEEKVQLKVLDCDSISQVKAKVLDALYKNTPHSLRPSLHDVDLEWRHGRSGRVILSDEDRTSVRSPTGGWRQVNTLAHFGIRDSAVMTLVPRQKDSFSSSNCTGYYSYANSVSPLSSPTGGNLVTTPSSRGPVVVAAAQQVYHLVRPAEDLSPLSGRERTYGTAPKAIPEVFLTRLLSTKGTVQQFVDDFFRTILSTNDALPPAVKWLFDLLDVAAVSQGLSDPEVTHAWKSNCLPLRFWVTFLKNPDFIFDVFKTPTVDACLAVVAQTFVDACATTEHRLGKDSPSNKLLFAKDIPRYRAQVRSFYADVKAAQPVSDQELSQHLQQLSAAHAGQFDALTALKELYIYVNKYYDAVLESLEVDLQCRKMCFGRRLQNVTYVLESCSLAPPPHPAPLASAALQMGGQLSEL